MGCHPNIHATKFPRQYPDKVGTRVEVSFHYARDSVKGTVVRDDAEEPYVTIFRLDDGRFVLSTECQYRPDDMDTEKAMPCGYCNGTGDARRG